jgi:hypothetical protein
MSSICLLSCLFSLRFRWLGRSVLRAKPLIPYILPQKHPDWGLRRKNGGAFFGADVRAQKAPPQISGIKGGFPFKNCGLPFMPYLK